MVRLGRVGMCLNVSREDVLEGHLGFEGGCHSILAVY